MYSASKNPVSLATLITAVGLLTAVNTLYGQTWTDHNAHDPGIVSLQATIPAFDESILIESPSSIYELYARIYAGNRISIIGSLPVSHFSSKNRIGTINETAVGNPYLGIRFESISPGLALETGFRLPIADDNNGIITGLLFENFVGEAFLPESPSLKSLLRYHYENDIGLTFRIGGGPHYWLLKNTENELLLSYYTQLHLRTSALALGIGLTGMGLISESSLSFSERTDQSLDLMASYTLGSVRTGVFIRSPLDEELRNTLSYSVGLSVAFILNRGYTRTSERLRHKDRAVN